MELKLYKDTLQSTEVVCNQKYEQPVEVEILIPEYLPAVFKIVKTIATPVILQKQVSGGRYAVDGYIRITMLYQPEGQDGICAIEQKMPFQKQFEMKQGPYNNHFGDITGEIGYLNCRAVNQRRVDIRGAYYFDVRVFGQYEQEVATAAAGAGICQKSEEVTASVLSAQGDKQFTLEGELQFPAPPQSILYTSCVANVSEVKMVSGKAVVRGEVKAEITYHEQDTASLHKLTQNLPFNQIVDVDGAGDDCVLAAYAEVPGCSIAEDGESTVITATCMLTLRMYKQTPQYLLKDAFSTKYESEVFTKEVWTDKLEDVISQNVDINISGIMPEENTELKECLLTLYAPQLVQEDGALAVCGKLVAHLICQNALGEMECYDKAGEYMLPQRYAAAPENTYLIADVSLVEKSASKMGAEANVAITLAVQGEVLAKQPQTVLEAMEETGEIDPKDNSAALIIYYAQKGEEVFYIAKHYHANPSDIATLAALSGDYIEEDCQLLIPAAE